jgi:5'-3' exonuclease
MDIPKFATALSYDLNDNHKPETSQKLNRIFDYILLCFFMGNDFLPHFPALNIRTTGIDRIMDAYKSVVGNTNVNLTEGDSIKWKNLRKVIMVLASSEEKLIHEEYQIREKQSRGTINRCTEMEDRLTSIPMLDRSVELYINPYETGWEERYYQRLFDVKIDDVRRKEICVNYLEGLEWTLKYYTTGCSDWRWTYKYNYPPLLKDLVKYMPAFDVNFIEHSTSRPVAPMVQLSYVIPRKSLYLLPEKLREQLLTKHSDSYSEDYEIEWAYCRYFWESHVKFRETNIQTLESLIESL